MAAPSKAAVVLKAVKRIAVHFSPFEANVRSTRYEPLVLSADTVCMLLFLRSRHNPGGFRGEADVLSRCCVIVGKLARCSDPTRFTTSSHVFARSFNPFHLRESRVLTI